MHLKAYDERDALCGWCASLQALQDKFFKELFRDCVSYAGAVIIRRILGIAHVVDYESIKDADERWALQDA